MSSWFSYIFSKDFAKQFLIMLVILLVLVFITFKWMNIYTMHGKSITLNDLNELTLEQAAELLESKHLKYEIVDSTSFNPEFLPLAVIKQDPMPDSKVKRGRMVYLWLNASEPPKKLVPCLAGDPNNPNKGNATLDESYLRLEQAGFKMGEITYRPMDEVISGNPVLEVRLNGKKLICGDKATYGTKIDLIVGERAGANKVKIPFLLGLTLGEAEFLIQSSELNLGTPIFETEGLIDSSSAVVYKQLPGFDTEGTNEIRVGSTIDIWLIQDLPAEVAKEIENHKNDTLSKPEAAAKDENE